MEITIKLQGNLKRFGSEFKINADKIKEGMSALLTQLAGFRNTIQKGQFHVIVGDKDLTNENIFPNFDEVLTKDTTLTIIPAIKGAKGGRKLGVLSVVVGAVLVAASWWAGGAAGFAYLGAAGYAGATATFMAGAALIASGVASMLTPTPKMPDFKLGEMSGNINRSGSGKEVEKKSSTSFSSTANMVAQGRPVPLAYGEIMTGSLVISKGTRTYRVDVYTPVEKTELKPENTIMNNEPTDKKKVSRWGLKRKQHQWGYGI